jgi:hypothetical protein
MPVLIMMMIDMVNNNSVQAFKEVAAFISYTEV